MSLSSFSNLFNKLVKKNMSKLAEMDEKDLIVIEEEVENTQLPTFIFKEAEEELTKPLILEGGEETDGALDLIAQIVQKIRHQIEKEDFGEALKNFSFTLTKIFTLLLNIKVDTGDKIIKIVQLLNSLTAKKWLEQK